MDHSKALFAFFGIGIAGLAFFASGHITPSDEGRDGSLVTGYQLNTYAREACLKAAKTRLDAPLYSPTEIRGDNADALDLNWQSTPENPHTVNCRFELEKGVTQMVIDGVALGAVSVDMGADSSRRGTGIKAEKHWGHW